MNTFTLPELAEKEKDEWRKIRRPIRGRRKSREERKENGKKHSSWDEPLREKLERELNEYGNKFDVKSSIEHLKNWKNERFEIKAIIGVFTEYAVYTCSYEKMKRELELMIRASRRYPGELKEIQEEMDYMMGDCAVVR